MKVNEGRIFVFIASIVIGLLISLNINFGNTEPRIILSSKEFQDSYRKKNNLYLEVSNLKDSHYQLQKKLDSYESGNKDKDKIVDSINNELNENMRILGYAPVKGQGIVITMVDALNEFNNSSDDNISRAQRIIHNIDILAVVNELKNLDAEAIAINGQRILLNSEVNCSGPFISVNQIKTPTPFYISVIGNKDSMKNYLLNNTESYIKLLINRGININIETKDELVIPAYIGSMKFKNLSNQLK